MSEEYQLGPDEENIKPLDWLPDGIDKTKYIKENEQWPGLERRIGRPRVLNNIYFPEVLDWINKNYSENPDDFSYFEAGCGHGNDIRAIKGKLNNKGRFLGVDISGAEIEHGLKYYHDNKGENTEEAKQLFAIGNLANLENVRAWNENTSTYSQPTKIEDSEFDLVHMEAVLHGFGYGKKTYREKKEMAQSVLNELFRICKNGGKFFGRATTFSNEITKEQQLALLRDTNNWRFIPELREFEEMLKKAGFSNIKISAMPHESASMKPEKKDTLRLSFLADKI